LVLKEKTPAISWLRVRCWAAAWQNEYLCFGRQQLSPQGKVLREKLMVVQLVREHSNLYGARMSAQVPSLSWDCWIQSTPDFLKIRLNKMISYIRVIIGSLIICDYSCYVEATRYGLAVWGLNPCGNENFRAHPDCSLSPTASTVSSLRYSGRRVVLTTHPFKHSRCEWFGTIRLHLHTHVVGWPLPSSSSFL
jgi:hypothetical protein